jgi:hypothetical protein
VLRTPIVRILREANLHDYFAPHKVWWFAQDGARVPTELKGIQEVFAVRRLRHPPPEAHRKATRRDIHLLRFLSR